jgi:hypothetical protein
MARTVILHHDYPYPPRNVWTIATDFACFAEAMKGVATFEGMPETGRLSADQSFDVKVRLFGKMPPMDYHMKLVHFDDDAMTFTSLEHGGAIKRWSHTLIVTASPDGARLTDRIEIDAGFLTFLMTLWAKFVYSKRHKPRLRMLAQ